MGDSVVFIPTNRNILVKVKPKIPEKYSLVLPEDYKRQNESKFEKVECVGWASDVKIDLIVGDELIIDRKMLDEIVISEEEKYQVILENYVVGVIRNKEQNGQKLLQ